MSSGLMEGVDLISMVRNGSNNQSLINKEDQVQLFSNDHQEGASKNPSGSDSNTQKTSDADTRKIDSPSKDYHPVVVEALHHEDLEDDISAVQRNTVSLLKNRSQRKK